MGWFLKYVFKTSCVVIIIVMLFSVCCINKTSSAVIIIGMLFSVCCINKTSSAVIIIGMLFSVCCINKVKKGIKMTRCFTWCHKLDQYTVCMGEDPTPWKICPKLPELWEDWILQSRRRIVNLGCLSGSSPVAQCVARRAPICSNAYGGWLAPRPRHSVRMTYRPSAALRLLGSLRISHNKFLRANK